MSIIEGSVVICPTGQAGTCAQIVQGEVWVLLTNKDFWLGKLKEVRLPQDQADLDACVLDVTRLK